MKATLKLISLMIFLTLFMVSEGLAKKNAYQVSPVTDGGNVKGTVLFKGKVPEPILEDLNKGKNVEFCAQHPDTREGGIRPRTKVAVVDGKLKNAVVMIENIASGKDWRAEPTQFDFKNCDIFPKVTVVRKAPKGMKEGLVKIENHDPDILHNPHGYSKVGANAKTLFNKPLPSKGDVADVTKTLKRLKMKKDKHFFLQCDQHNYMEADARIVWNPYYTVTGDDGTFMIDQIPAGTYRITAWHPYLGEVAGQVTIEKGKTAGMDLDLTGK